ncbi:hypothetical protein KBY96_06735 [Cyanobium sp. ATX 6A2]|uniref:hypothetical protein n=1 Tax=Cyanobium sp. ATX 6A2 TaxID=2823700 RepID=UPI0020CC2733|nr:hypothetical protein [Cyanobium sp. ATX 6A2]MCP9887629.1 hypothetical protein [Cyanobium sp. ATX 6A2]
MLYPTAASVGGCPWELVEHALRREQDHPHEPLFGTWRQVDAIRSGTDRDGNTFIEWVVLEVDVLGQEHQRRHIAYRVPCPECGRPMASGPRRCRHCDDRHSDSRHGHRHPHLH